jgi:hypothetical protein
MIAYVTVRPRQPRMLQRRIPSTHPACPPCALPSAADFGIARVLKHTMECAKTVVGTPYYLSPVSARARARGSALLPPCSDAAERQLVHCRTCSHRAAGSGAPVLTSRPSMPP